MNFTIVILFGMSRKMFSCKTLKCLLNEQKSGEKTDKISTAWTILAHVSINAGYHKILKIQ